MATSRSNKNDTTGKFTELGYWPWPEMLQPACKHDAKKWDRNISHCIEIYIHESCNNYNTICMWARWSSNVIMLIWGKFKTFTIQKSKLAGKSGHCSTWRVSPPSPMRWRSMLRIGWRNCNKEVDSTFFKLLMACTWIK